MANWEAIQREWETSKITLADLAEKHGVKLGTLKSRKSREKWSRDSKKVATSSGKVATKKKVPEPVAESDGLTDKQRLFCLHYIKCFNATKAYQKAYGVDYASAMRAGSRLLRNVEIREEIQQLKDEKAEGLMLDARDVLQKYIDIAFADITDFVSFGKMEVPRYTENGDPVLDDNGVQMKEHYSYVDLNESEEVDGTIITEVKQGREGVSVKLADKMKALDFLMKHFDMLSHTQKERVEMEKAKADAEFSKERAEKLKGTKKDTGLLDALIEGRKRYEQNHN